MKILPVLLALAIILSSSCKDQPQLSNKKSKHPLTNIKSPKVDSALQFTLMITSIFQDSKGNYWFGTHGDGLCQYNGKEYIYYTAESGLPKGVDREFAPGPDWDITRIINGGNQISSIQEDENGNILFVNGEGEVCKFDGQIFKVLIPAKEASLTEKRTDNEWEADQECLWFGSWQRLGAYRYDGKELTFLHFPLDYLGSRDGVSEVYKDKEGSIWFGTMENGTFRYNGSSIKQIFPRNEIGISRSIFQDSNNIIWLTNNRVGLYYLENDSLYNFTTAYSLRNPNDPLKDEFKTSYQSIEQDQNGDLWFGTFSSGLWRYDGKQLQHYTESDSLPIVTVKTIYKDKSGQLWFGIGEGTVYGFDGESFYRFDEKESSR